MGDLSPCNRRMRINWFYRRWATNGVKTGIEGFKLITCRPVFLHYLLRNEDGFFGGGGRGSEPISDEEDTPAFGLQAIDELSRETDDGY